MQKIFAEIHFCIFFFIWACRRGGYGGICEKADVETRLGASLQNGRDFRRRAVGLSALMILAWNPPPFRETRSVKRNLRLAGNAFPPKSFPLQSLTQARRTPHPFRGEQRIPFVSTFSRAAIFPRTHPISTKLSPLTGLLKESR
ncbi:MAG: hypothetical protein K5890_08980 [Bacteroidales bacterium]|nr:hypothetical protein [Bacteroidales bacterium]